MQQLEIAVPSRATRIQSGQKPKREWAAAHRMVNPAGSSVQASDIAAATTSMQETDITVPFIPHHALPGPSGTQVQSEFGNVSIFT